MLIRHFDDGKPDLSGCQEYIEVAAVLKYVTGYLWSVFPIRLSTLMFRRQWFISMPEPLLTAQGAMQLLPAERKYCHCACVVRARVCMWLILFQALNSVPHVWRLSIALLPHYRKLIRSY